MDEKLLSNYLRAIGDSTRLKILRLLAAGELTVSEIVEELGLSQSTISRHLALLRQVGFVSDRRQGQQVFYSLNKGAVWQCCEGLCIRLDIRPRPTAKKK